MSACPECCGPKDTPITYTYCFRCSEAKATTPNPLRSIIDDRDRYRAALIDASGDIETIMCAGFDSSRREAAESALQRIRMALAV